MCNGILFSHGKEEILQFATTGMKLEGVMLSEKSQTEKNKYCMVFFKYMESVFKKVKLVERENRKMVAKRWGVGDIGRGW